MHNLDMTGLNYLMGLVGTKYLPSVYYKVRLIPFDSGAIQGQVPAAQGVQAPGDVDDKGFRHLQPLEPPNLDEDDETIDET